MNKKNTFLDFKLDSYLKNKRELINNNLLSILSKFEKERELITAMKYSLMAKGKRLRPILCIASAECVQGYDKKLNNRVILPACAIEMIHTYSLIHDDLPAMDDDELRRGIPTSHKKFSEATAILAGDALLTHAFNILSSSSISKSQTFPNNILLNIIRVISEAAGTNGMIEGQMLDMQAESGLDTKVNSDSLGYLKKMHSLKTGKMIAASVKVGAIAAGADQDQLSKLVSYAENIGMAFQIVDDILDIEGDSSVIGKPVGSDKINKKLTFPGIIGLEESKKYAEQLIFKAIKSIENFGDKALPLKKIASYIIERKR